MEQTYNFGIRNTATGEVVRRCENPIEAKKLILAMRPEGYADFEVVERSAQNVYKMFPDGRSYIVGVEYKWVVYPI